MKLETLKQHIDRFARFLTANPADEHCYKYALLANFQQNLLNSDSTLAARYRNALRSDTTRRWWDRTGSTPKETMLRFIDHRPDYVEQAFKDLFDESKSLDRRLDRFQFYCDELLRMFKASHRDEVINNHDQDATMQSIYLSGVYPHLYTIYPGLDPFNQFMERLEGKPSLVDDLERFFKIMRNAHRFLMMNDDIKSAIETSIRKPDHLLLAHEFVYFVNDQWSQTSP